jgi:hypothetical protein
MRKIIFAFFARSKLPILSNIPANISNLMARCTREGHHSFFRLKLVTLDAPTTCLINIGGHREKALHSYIFRATKCHRRAAETYLQRDTQAGRDWPVYVKYRFDLRRFNAALRRLLSEWPTIRPEPLLPVEHRDQHQVNSQMR